VTSGTTEKGGLRGLMWALLATIVGMAMIAGGIYGLIKPEKKRTASIVTVPAITPSPFAFQETETDLTTDCGERDPRFPKDITIRFTGVRSTGTVDARVSCAVASIVLGFSADNVTAGVGTSYEVWLYNNKKDATKVGELFTPARPGTKRGSGIGTAYIPPYVDTTDYGSLVLVRRDVTDVSRKPSPIGFRAQF
jgi:hypothetical protein